MPIARSQHIPPHAHPAAVPNIFWHPTQVGEDARVRLLRQRPATIWLTGFSGAGKSTIAYGVEKLLLKHGHACYVLDGDNLRHHLNRDLDFSAHARRENIRRAAEVARLMNEAGLIVLTAFISPFREDREMAQAIIGEERFVEVHVSTPMDVCEARDPKGLYAKARTGAIPHFTGISSPYETPLAPRITLDTSELPIELSTRLLFAHLADGFFEETPE